LKVIWSLAEWRKGKTGAVDIDLGVPIPEIVHPRKHPWRTLAKDGSFYVPQRGKPIKKLWNSLTSSRAWAQKKTQARFSMRQDGYGIRVFRVS